MRAIFFIIMCLSTLTPARAESSPDPGKLFRDGLSRYEDGQFQEGLDLLAQALEAFQPESARFDLAQLHYNIGIGHYRLSQPEEAAASFQAALRSSELKLQSSSYFNLGNARYQSAQLALNEGDVAAAFQQYQAAASNFVQSLRLASDDQDAKINYELCILAQRRILSMVALAMQHMQQGEQLVGQYKFVEAAQWFAQNREAIDKALSLEPEAKKQFDQMTQRTTSVAELISPPPSALPGAAP